MESSKHKIIKPFDIQNVKLNESNLKVIKNKMGKEAKPEEGKVAMIVDAKNIYDLFDEKEEVKKEVDTIQEQNKTVQLYLKGKHLYLDFNYNKTYYQLIQVNSKINFNFDILVTRINTDLSEYVECVFKRGTDLKTINVNKHIIEDIDKRALKCDDDEEPFKEFLDTGKLVKYVKNVTNFLKDKNNIYLEYENLLKESFEKEMVSKGKFGKYDKDGYAIDKYSILKTLFLQAVKEVDNLIEIKRKVLINEKYNELIQKHIDDLV